MKSFNEVYEQVHKESFEELEILRKKSKKRIFITLLVVGVFIAFIVFFLNKADIGEIMYGGQAIFVTTFCAAIFIIVIYRMGEFEGYDNYYTEDLIIGKLDEKYNFQMAEVKTEEESTDSDGDTHTSIVFYGLFGNIECAKNIGTKFKVRSDKGIFGKMFKGKTKVEMDSQEFEKYFDVYGDNKIIVMQILTSEVMSTMIDFIQQSKIKYELTINKDQIYIRFHTGGLFEPSLFKNSLDYSMLKKYYDILDFVFKVTREINSVIEKTDI